MILPVALAVIAATVAISASAGTMAKAGVRGLCACCGVVPYRLTFENTVHYPSGYASECVIEDVKLRHEFVLDRNAAFRRITVVENPQKKSVRCRIVQMQSGMGQGAKWMIGEMEFK